MDNVLTFIFGLAFDPRATAKKAFTDELPPYVFACLLCFLLTIAVPVYAQMIKYNAEFHNVQIALSIMIVCMIALPAFVVGQGLLLSLFGIDTPFFSRFALMAYMLAQLTFAIWILYAIDYMRNGTLNVVVSFMTGYISPLDQTTKAIPYLFGYVQLLTIILVTSTIRTLSGASRFTAFLLALLSSIPFYGSFAAGVYVGDAIRPGTLAIFYSLLF